MTSVDSTAPDYVTVVYADLENCTFWGGTIAGTSRMIMYCKGEKLRSNEERRVQGIQKRYLTQTEDGHSCCQIIRNISAKPPEHPTLLKRVKRIINRYFPQGRYEDERDNSL